MKRLMLILFILFMAVPGVWITVQGITGQAETYSEAEQRMLETFPEFSASNLKEY